MATIYKGSHFNIVGNTSSRTDIENAWKTFIEIGAKPNDTIRPEILLSWERSAGLGVNPFQEQVNKNVTTNELIDWKGKNEELLYYARRDMQYLTKAIEGSETIITISDDQGLLLDSYGDPGVKMAAEQINFIPGAVWSEQSAGTNAIGTVIETGRPAHIKFSEHYSVGWHDWFCAGAPILNPFTNKLMGVLDLSGKWDNTNPHTLGLVIAKANSISDHLEKILYHEGIKLNPFLMTAIGSVQDGVMITDEKKNVLKSNRTMESIIFTNQNVSAYPEIDKLVTYILESNAPMVEEEVIVDFNKREKFICTVYPVKLNKSNIIGTFVRLQKTKVASVGAFNGITLPSSIDTDYNFSKMIGSSASFKQVVEKAKKAARLNSTLLLNGETGTGKELFVQSIHNASERRDGPFIAINTGAISRDLIVSELFGYEQGAFTGANKRGNPGKFEMADGGTIFLDEIGDMPLEAQVHLLRVLEERVVTRIGGSKAIPVDVRVIAATHRDLNEAVEKGDFRADLYFRLRVIQLNIPSLRERKDDIPELVYYFINQIGNDFGKSDIKVNSEALALLQAYPWPGNIRELKNVVEHSLFSMEGDVMLPNDLPEEIREQSNKPTNDVTEKQKYIEMIKSTDGNVSEAAVQLGISRATMYRRMKQMGITKDLLT